MVKPDPRPTPLTAPAPDQAETARLLQPHPPTPIPPRGVAPAPDGLVAHTVLGHRVHK